MNKKEEIHKKYNDLLANETEKDKIDLEAHLLSFRLLAEISDFYERRKAGFKKVKLAEDMGSSKVFITKLFNGDNLLNLKMLGKLQLSLGIKFKVTIESKSDFTILSTQQKWSEIRYPTPNFTENDSEGSLVPTQTGFSIKPVMLRSMA